MNRLRCVLFLAAASVSLPLIAADPTGQPATPDRSPVAIRAFFTADNSGAGNPVGGDTMSGVVSVQATLAAGWHTYSVTEAAAPNRTRITLAPSGQYHQSGAIRADVDPRRSYQAQGSPPVETHEGTVTWTVPVRFARGVDLSRLQVGGLLELMLCSDQSCQPIAGQFAAVYQAAVSPGGVEQGIVERGIAEPSGGSIISDGAVSPVAAIETEQFATALGKPNKFDDILGGLPGAGGTESSDQLTVTASVKPAEGDKPAQLIIEGTIASGWHIFSLTQPKNGPAPTKIDVKITGDASVAGDFKPDPEPKKHFDSDVFKIILEEHEGKVRWTAPLKIGKGAEAAGLKIHGTVSAQACSDKECVQRSVKFVAIDTTKKAAEHVGQYRAPGSNVIIRGLVEPATVATGGTIKLLLTAEPQGNFHVYPVKEKPAVAKPTRIVVSDLPAGWTAGEPTPSAPPVMKDGDAYHVGPVTWAIDIKVPENAKPGPYKLEGGIAYMACETDKACEPPKGAIFDVSIEVGTIFGAAVNVGTKNGGQRPLNFFASNYGEVEKRALSAEEIAQREALRNQVRPVVKKIIESTDVELYSHNLLSRFSSVVLDQLPKVNVGPESMDFFVVLASLGGGFLGGLLLNVMPCVLPVIGLKIMSFVQQGGERRGRVLALNVWFSLGLISVFMILAVLAAFLHLGWGGQFQQGWFTIVLACVVFAFALAMIGVWEIPIPGFVGSGAVSDLATKEGPAGAFSKGVLTTLLATPCTGPFLGPALAWAVKQPLPLVFAMFFAVGLGMASPYLLIGAFPKLIAFLPKPGEWMETFKKLMGFVLLATVVWLLSFVPMADVVPTVTVMCGIGLGLWWIGRVPLTESGGKRLLAWGQGAAMIVAASFFSFAWFNGVMKDRAERRFKSDMISRLVKFADKPEDFQKAERPAGRYTVMVDFTADWCFTCKTNEQFVLSSKRTQEVIDQNNVVFLVADITQTHPEAEDLLERLGNEKHTIPYVVIFPADDPNQPIVLDGPLTQGRLDAALKKAGPSKLDSGVTAMRNETTSR